MRHLLSLLLLIGAAPSFCQTIKPDLRPSEKWSLHNRQAEFKNENGRAFLYLNEAEKDGLMILKDVLFQEGVIEFDVRGKNAMGQSFVGLAFNVQDDSTFDAVYFRPFNFKNPDTLRQYRAVQYISMPGHPWEKLRSEHPGKYESKVNPPPDPDSWFHVKIIVSDNRITSYVNNSAKPSLEVQKLSGTSKGKVALWVGNNSSGSFSNLVIARK